MKCLHAHVEVLKQLVMILIGQGDLGFVHPGRDDRTG